jgi:hypothetical protein
VRVLFIVTTSFFAEAVMAPFTKSALSGVALALSFAAVAAPVVYPAKGQSAKQQQSDDGACVAWAKSNTGIDPAAVAANPPPAQTGPAVGGGQRVQGAARGAVAGAVVGSIAGNDTGHSAAVGAAAGTVVGGSRARREQRAQNQQAANQQQGAMDTYYRAYSACMEGRGYTIK